MTRAAPRRAAFSAVEVCAIQAQTEALLRTELWRQAPRQQRLLRHIVQATLADDAQRLHGQVLGREVFDRGPDFDPTVDPIVRVEAARLRAKLLSHYAGAGAHDAVWIEVPKGGYAARFVFRAPDAIAAETAAPDLLAWLPGPTQAARREPLAGGIAAFWSLDAPGLEQAQQRFADAVARDPGYAAAHAWLAVAAINRHAFTLDLTDASLHLARHHASRALALAPDLALAHATHCAVMTWGGQPDVGIAAGQRALAIDPNYADAHALLSLALACSLRLQDALAEVDLALQLAPHPPGYVYWVKGMTLQMMDRDAQARGVYAEGLAASPSHPWCRIGLALSLLRTGQIEQAHEQVECFRRWFPHPQLLFRNRFLGTEVRARHAVAMGRLGFVALS
ncbi:tetratricopeptide repeat protein [Variovorax sp. YR752]|uniref:tetratricopeptide repeat protein n=1 Tax=Variovorax sp. YR752 TaxID=1884383 RepID=UPI00313828BE